MSEVTLSIGGKDYAVACGDGEEGHILKLGRAIDEKLTQMGDAGTNESRRLLFAALLLADEVGELKGRPGNSPAPAAPSSAPSEDRELASSLERMADRLESCASLLEKP